MTQKAPLTIVLFLLISVGCFAQINRTVWGMTLGKSSKQQVKTILEQKGYYVNTEPDGSYDIKADYISFGGAIWNYANFSFVDGYLSTIWFHNNALDSPVSIVDTFDKVKDSLFSKYRIYYEADGVLNNGTAFCNYSDERTNVILYLDPPTKTRRLVSLTYEDIRLNERKNQADLNEL